jgi:hypothetical protein
MEFTSICLLNSYLNTNPLDASTVIDNNFFISKYFIGSGVYNADIFFGILKKYDYSIDIMKQKIFYYINHLKNQPNKELNYIIFNPFCITYSKGGRTVYEKQKYYDSHGNLRYNGYISKYEYFPKSTNKIDIYKINKIQKLFEDFFYLKELFEDKIPKECIKIIWDYLIDWGNNTPIDNVIWELRNIIRNDTNSRYENA